MIEDFKKDAMDRMAKCVQQFHADLKKLRTGRAHPSLIENLKVDYYGTETPLQQLANIGIEDARTLVVTPWDKAAVQAVEKAIYKSELGLTPNTAGTVIRIPLPPLTEERRRDITKVVRGDAEGARVAVRNVRRDVLQDVKEALKEKMISQDEERKSQEEIQKLTAGVGSQGEGDHAGLTRVDLHASLQYRGGPACPHRDRHGWQRPLG